jgi:hypothetical protein
VLLFFQKSIGLSAV